MIGPTPPFDVVPFTRCFARASCTLAAVVAPAASRASEARPPTFLGEPRGLAYLTFTETWERFSYYGMTSLLTLYMTQALLTPGRLEHVVGIAALRGALERAFGPMTTLGFASQIFGLYTGFVYFTPVFGGWIADRWIGRRNAVSLGAVLMSAGHVAMAFDPSFLVALALLCVGCGLLKGNISTQVGGLYTDHDVLGRTRGFSIFSTGINIGAAAGPFFCGLLAQVYGWHTGFGLASALMLVGLATYLAGYRHLPDGSPARPREVAATPRRARARVLAVLVLVIGISVFQSVALYQELNVGLVWISKAVDTTVLGFRIPVAWFASADSCVSIAAIAPLLAFWRRQAKRGREPSELGKMAIGAWLTAVGNLWLAAMCALFGRVSPLVPLVYSALLSIGFLYYWPTLLALVSRAAPPHLKATMMGAVFLFMFVANLALGALGGLYERLGPAAFWTMHACIAAVGGALATSLGGRLERWLAADG